jgi:hypothetical protein
VLRAVKDHLVAPPGAGHRDQLLHQPLGGWGGLDALGRGWRGRGRGSGLQAPRRGLGELAAWRPGSPAVVQVARARQSCAECSPRSGPTSAPSPRGTPQAASPAPRGARPPLPQPLAPRRLIHHDVLNVPHLAAGVDELLFDNEGRSAQQPARGGVCRGGVGRRGARAGLTAG